MASDKDTPFLIAYELLKDPPEIVPGERDRDWMSVTPERFAYRCLPLNIANQLGWDILCGTSFTCMWTGSENKHSIEIQFDGAARADLVVSHFGSGVLTFKPGYLFRTPPTHNLWVKGAPNFYKDGIVPLEGIVETDWAPYSFTMNWKFTRPRHPVRFEKGEPICRILPYPRHYADGFAPVIRPLHAEKTVHERYVTWDKRRDQFNKDLEIEGSKAWHERWQRDYMRGQDLEGHAFEEHETKLSLRPFKRK